jgi:hypothetical protein
VAEETRPGLGPIVDCNVHLWDQDDDPVFWLSDRTLPGKATEQAQDPDAKPVIARSGLGVSPDAMACGFS